MRYFLGIDPGLDGAAALLDPDGAFVWVRDTPVVTKVDTQGRDRREYALSDMRRILIHAAESGVVACLEAVHSMPKQGVASTFALGRGFGIWLGLLAGVQIPFVMANPVRWKHRFGLHKAGKDAARVQAQQYWPTADLHLKKHHGRADALFLAQYARLLNQEAGATVKGGNTDGDRTTA